MERSSTKVCVKLEHICYKTMRTNDKNSAGIQTSQLQQIKKGLSLASFGLRCVELAVLTAWKTDFFPLLSKGFSWTKTEKVINFLFYY